MTTITEYFRQIDRACARYFYQENLACRPQFYKGYPCSLFPRLRNFRQLFATVSSWDGLDMNAPGHIYMERLYERLAN